MRQNRLRAFSLVEILLVVLILGVLATVVLPEFTNTTADSRNSAASTTLQSLRGQIEVFKTQHGDVPPQQGSMWTLMQTSSTTSETTNPSTGTNFGPYIKTNPQNPWNTLTSVSSSAIDTSAGWYYTADTTNYDLRVRNADGSVNYSY